MAMRDRARPWRKERPWRKDQWERPISTAASVHRRIGRKTGAEVETLVLQWLTGGLATMAMLVAGVLIATDWRLLTAIAPTLWRDPFASLLAVGTAAAIVFFVYSFAKPNSADASVLVAAAAVALSAAYVLQEDSAALWRALVQMHPFAFFYILMVVLAILSALLWRARRLPRNPRSVTKRVPIGTDDGHA